MTHKRNRWLLPKRIVIEGNDFEAEDYAALCNLLFRHYASQTGIGPDCDPDLAFTDIRVTATVKEKA